MPTRFGTTPQAILSGVPALLLAMGCAEAGVTEPDPISDLEVMAEARPEWVTRPMRMTLAVEVQGPVADPLPECAVAHLASVIEGTASHLGHVSGIGSTCIQSLAPDEDPPFLPPGPAPWATASFSNPLWVLTAANGDELRLQGGVATAVLGIDPTDGSFTDWPTWWVKVTAWRSGPPIPARSLVRWVRSRPRAERRRSSSPASSGSTAHASLR